MHRRRSLLGMFALAPALVLAVPARAQVTARPKDSRLAVDVAPPLRPANVVVNVSHDGFTGTLPTGLYAIELLLAAYKGSSTPLRVVALFQDKGAYLLLDDAAYKRNRHLAAGNPWKQRIAALQAAGVAFELDAFAAYTNEWTNADLLPGVKVAANGQTRLIGLLQDGWVQLHP